MSSVFSAPHLKYLGLVVHVFEPEVVLIAQSQLINTCFQLLHLLTTSLHVCAQHTHQVHSSDAIEVCCDVSATLYS
jgi:hypothetical protein